MAGFPPKSSILRGISIINHPCWGTPYFWKHPYVPCQLDSCQDGPTIEADPQSTGEKPVVGSTGGEKLPQHARKRRKSVTAGGEMLEMLEGMVGWEDSRVGQTGVCFLLLGALGIEHGGGVKN